MILPVIPSCVTAAVGAASAQFSTTMQANRLYLLVSNVACWAAQAANPTALTGAGTGRFYVPANTQVIVNGDHGAKLALIQDSTGGFASLTPIQP